MLFTKRNPERQRIGTRRPAPPGTRWIDANGDLIRASPRGRDTRPFTGRPPTRHHFPCVPRPPVTGAASTHWRSLERKRGGKRFHIAKRVTGKPSDRDIRIQARQWLTTVGCDAEEAKAEGGVTDADGRAPVRGRATRRGEGKRTVRHVENFSGERTRERVRRT